MLIRRSTISCERSDDTTERCRDTQPVVAHPIPMVLSSRWRLAMMTLSLDAAESALSCKREDFDVAGISSQWVEVITGLEKRDRVQASHRIEQDGTAEAAEMKQLNLKETHTLHWNGSRVLFPSSMDPTNYQHKLRGGAKGIAELPTRAGQDRHCHFFLFACRGIWTFYKFYYLLTIRSFLPFLSWGSSETKALSSYTACFSCM